MQRRCSLPLLVALLALPSPVLAQGVDPASATALFQQGREASKRGDYVTACAKLDQSYRLDAAVGTLLNLADCQEHLGKTATAWQLFQQALERLGRQDDRIPQAKKRIAELEGRLSRLEVTLAPGVPPGTAVTRDGAAVGNLGIPQIVDPGAHVLVATAPGRVDHRVDVSLAEGQVARVAIEAGAVVPAPLPPARAMSPMRLAGILVGSAGVAGLVAAVASGLALPAQEKIIEAHCGPPVHPANLCDATGYQAAQRGKSLAALNTAAWALGAAATAAGVVLVIVGGRTPKQDEGGSAPAPLRAAVQITPATGGVAASLQGSF